MKNIILSLLLSVCISIIYAQADSTLKEFTGRYIFEAGNVVPDVTVTLEVDKLSMSSTAGVSMLEKAGIDSFTIIEFSGIAVFQRNENKIIHGVHIEAGGYVMDGTKEETGWSFHYYLKPLEQIVTKK